MAERTVIKYIETSELLAERIGPDWERSDYIIAEVERVEKKRDP